MQIPPTGHFADPSLGTQTSPRLRAKLHKQGSAFILKKYKQPRTTFLLLTRISLPSFFPLSPDEDKKLRMPDSG